MVSSRKTLLALVVFAMVMNQASASKFLDNFEEFALKSITLDSFKLYVFNMLWYTLAPLVYGVLDVLIEYVWNGNETRSVTVEGNTVTFTYAQGLVFKKIGTRD